MNLAQSFYTELDALRKKYPMCYIEAWTPDDFVCNAATGKDDEEDGEASAADWEDPAHVGVAENLYDSFDANLGTNWDAIAAAI